jgi:hypothetical protein
VTTSMPREGGSDARVHIGWMPRGAGRRRCKGGRGTAAARGWR